MNETTTYISANVKHTPGPWAIGELSDGESTHVCIAPESKLKSGGKGPAVCLISGVETFEATDAANALLIAAAPDLLSALKAVTGACSSRYWHGTPVVIDTNLIADALDAIAKAEGKRTP